VRAFLLSAMLAFATLFGATAAAQSVIDEWASIKTPPPPPLKPAQADAKTTALLMLDFVERNCGPRPRCVASEPKVKELLARARNAGATVIYTLVANTTTADVRKELAPKGDEPTVLSGPDKFVNTDLEKILKDRGIQTVIAVGTAAHGAVLHTATSAAFRGMNVIVPVDGMSANDPYPEQYTAWHLVNGPTLAQRVTLTTTDQVKF
jgi:nicotinamidase-related amidase